MGSFFRLDSVDSDSSGASVSEEQFKSLSAMVLSVAFGVCQIVKIPYLLVFVLIVHHVCKLRRKLAQRTIYSRDTCSH
jgi:Flp pilus assembly protein TadB